MEVDQKANGIAAESQVRQQLCLVDGQHLREGFQLDEDSILNEQVDAITNVDLASAVREGDRGFNRNTQPLEDEFLMEANTIRTLEKSRSQRRVHLDCRADDLTRDVVIQHY